MAQIPYSKRTTGSMSWSGREFRGKDAPPAAHEVSGDEAVIFPDSQSGCRFLHVLDFCALLIHLNHHEHYGETRLPEPRVSLPGPEQSASEPDFGITDMR